MSVMYHDESGVSVIIGTLMLILITITAASGLALMVSGMQKEAMERESHLAAVASENLRIISIDPVENSTDPAQWDSVNVTLMNLNTADSRVTAISLNGMHARNYLAKDASGNLDYYEGYPSYPVVYNFKKRVIVPAAGSKEICLNFSGIVVDTSDTSEKIDVSGWNNISKDHPFTPLNRPYTRAMYPNVNYSTVKIYNNSASGLRVNESGNYSIDHIAGTITLLGGGNMTNTSNYIFNCTTTRFDTFTSPPLVDCDDPLTIEVITSLINIFKRTFMPPVPLAEVQFETERLVDSGGNESYRNYLILDASESFDPDGFITGYWWAVWNNSSEEIYYYNLTGMKARPVELNLTTCENVEIDLEVLDDTGMVSWLSQRSGNITIP